MGITHVEASLTGASKKPVVLKFLVDSGATYTLLPYEAWKKLGLKPKKSMEFTLADGTSIERKISECHISLPQGEAHTPVILGEPGDQPLLGVVTLEILGIVFNPFKRTLHPMQMMLA